MGARACSRGRAWQYIYIYIYIYIYNGRGVSREVEVELGVGVDEAALVAGDHRLQAALEVVLALQKCINFHNILN